MKKSIIESIILYSIIPIVLVSVILCLYLENEIDQLGKAFVYGLKYTIIPFFFLFFIILYPIHKNFKIVLKRSIQFALIYSLCAIIPILLINNNLGKNQDITISGVVINMKPGRGNGKPTVTVKTNNKEITFRLVREKWATLAVGKNVDLKAKKGSLGLIYN